MRYASEKDRMLAHLIYAVAALRDGRSVVAETERLAFAVNALTAMGVDSIDMGVAILEGLPYYATDNA